MTRLGLFLALSFVVWSLPSSASGGPIDLESFADAEILTSQIPGLTFTNATVFTAGISLNDAELPPASGANVAIDIGGPMRIAFASPVTGFGAFFTYLTPISLEAFDGANGSLGVALSNFSSNLALSGDLGSAPNEFLQVAFGGISYVVITGDPFGTSFAIDDLVVTTVPEPTTVLLVGAGMVVGIGAWRRRRYEAAAGGDVPRDGGQSR
jgi:hypothetical protein